MESPLISILMNCYNGERYLREALDSVINQTYKNWEIVFWDNRSFDESAKIFKSYSDKRFKYYLSKDHSGLGKARKRAFEHLNGEYIAVLDTDDIWYPTKLERQLSYFNKNNVGIVISNAHFFNEKKKVEIYKENPYEGWVFNKLLENYFVCLVTLMFRKSLVKKLDNNFDSDFDFISDFDLVLRISKISKLRYCNSVLAGWRAHGNNDTFKSPYNFIEETERWIIKQEKLKLFDNTKNKESLNILRNKQNRQIALFELIHGNRLSCIKKLISQKNKTIKDYVIFLAAILFISKKSIKSLYLNRISLGLLN